MKSMDVNWLPCSVLKISADHDAPWPRNEAKSVSGKPGAVQSQLLRNPERPTSLP
jgi:hypothetical protein